MRQFLLKNGREINSLFLQLSQFCQLNCPNCYALAHKTGNVIKPSEWHELFDMWYVSPNYWTNQITISLDKLNRDDTKRQYMLLALDGILKNINKDKRNKEDKPAVSFTVHSLSDLKEYVKEGCVFNWSNIDFVAFSVLKPADFDELIFKNIKQQSKVVHNLLAYSKEQVLRDIEKSIYFVDTVHLVMFKNLSDSKKAGLSTMENYKEIYDTVKNNPKISIDRCYNACLMKSGCSAGTSLMQVWPDGSVSGCPYMKNSETKGGNNYLEVLDNIKERQFMDCETNCIYKEVL